MAEWAMMADETILFPMYRYAPVSLDTSIVAGVVLLQAVLDEDFALPILKSDTDLLFERYKEHLDGRRLRTVEKKFERTGTPLLGRHEFDSMSSEGEGTPIEQKLETIKTVIGAGIPLLDAVMVYRHWYRERSRRYVLDQLPQDLYGLVFHQIVHRK